MPEPRGIEDRLDWFLTHDPSGSGMCAQHTWHALGGDQGNPPAWGCSDANECVAKVRASGRYETPSSWDGPPPRGAWVGYSYGSNGHACLSLGDGRIVTTDPGSGEPTGIEDLDYPNRWGASGWDVWTDEYNGVRFPVAADANVTEQIYSDRLGYGEPTNGDLQSDTVAELQAVLNRTSMDPPGDIVLPLTGFYDDETDTVVRAWQEQVAGDTPDPEGQSYLGERQRALMFPGPPYTIHDRGLPAIATDPTPDPPPDPTPPDPPSSVTFPLGIEYHYSGKPAGTLTFSGSYKRLDVDSWKPTAAGLTFGMLYANVDGSGEFRTRLIREDLNGSGEDPTAYQSHYPKSGDNYLVTHVWFESGEANRGLHYELSTMDGETMTVGTRYAKFVTIPWDVVLLLTELGATYQAVRPRLRPLLQLLGVALPDDLRQVLGDLLRDRA